MQDNETEDPFAVHTDEEDPFAASADVKSGPFTPRPALEDLEGRLLVLVPRALDKEAKTPEEWVRKGAQPTREQYTVDMVVLDGGPLTYQYKDKVTKDGATTVQMKEFEVPALPFMWAGVWRSEASIIGQLKRVDGTKKPMLLGVLRKGPQADDRKNGVTWQDIARLTAEWRKNPRGNAPSFSWFIDVEAGETPGARTLAHDWWALAKASGYQL